MFEVFSVEFQCVANEESWDKANKVANNEWLTINKDEIKKTMGIC